MGKKAKQNATKSKPTDDDDGLLEQAVAAANAERHKAQVDASPYKRSCTRPKRKVCVIRFQ